MVVVGIWIKVSTILVALVGLLQCFNMASSAIAVAC